ncbi:hypothetical protein OUZ56_018951 [Daphnia magna]|uniref:Uncharacterized protein n=1 Tax=Daphnia magna TaxID=35525 RepID=A0ABQ9ZBB3_9CRUS|nr:hypothetical protein OUZ56_018951 [Daphnia magna]
MRHWFRQLDLGDWSSGRTLPSFMGTHNGGTVIYSTLLTKGDESYPIPVKPHRPTQNIVNRFTTRVTTFKQ